MHGGVAAGMPVQIDPAAGLFLEFLKRGAVDGVDHHALPAIGDADDAFAWNGLAAGGAAEGLVIGQAHDGAGGIHLVILGAGEFGVERFHHAAGGDFGAAEAGEQILAAVRSALSVAFLPT